MKSPIVLLSSLLDDVKRLEPDVRNLDRDLKTVEARFKHEGIGFLTNAFSSYCDALDEGLAMRRFTCPAGFKTGGLALPRFLSGLLCEVFDERTGLLKENPRMGYLKCLREILRLFRKLPLSSDRDLQLDKEAKDKFLSCDESITQTVWNERYKHHLMGVCRLVLNQLEGVDYENLSCKHGPGAVSERLTANQKWNAVASSLWNNPEELEGSGYDSVLVDMYTSEAFCNSEEELQRNQGVLSVKRPSQYRSGQRKADTDDIGCLRDTRFERPSAQSIQTIISEKQSRLVTVAKNSTSRRTITVEPVLKQFMQQGLNVVLRDNISKCRILSNCLDLAHQSHNQILALEGSRTGLWATLDLSSASDLLSLELVKFVFQSKPTFQDWLVRSRSTEYSDGRNHRVLLKYAGMGNATTFPVQSVTFALLAIAAILDEVGLKPTYVNVKRASRLVRVYGDDIIVPSQYSRQVVNWIEHFGLKVNTKKSFTDYKNWWEHQSCFRESCGVDAYGGVDITPLYLRALPNDAVWIPNGSKQRLSTDPSAIASLVATSNLAWERCLYKFSATLAQSVERTLKKVLPLVPARSSALGWHSRIDACNPTKWDHSLQRLVFKAPVLKPISRSDRLEGYAALLKFYHVPLLGRGPGHLKRSQERFSSRIAWRWMPADCW